MEATEATPNLKPRKHAWSAACFLAWVLTAVVGVIDTMLRLPYPANAWPVERLDYVAQLMGSALWAAVVFIPLLVFVLALLFFFDGWFSKTIVGMVLFGWMLFQAVQLGTAVRQQLLADAPPASQQVRMPMDEASSIHQTASAPESHVAAAKKLHPNMRRLADSAAQNKGHLAVSAE